MRKAFGVAAILVALLLPSGVAAAAPAWDLTGEWTVQFDCTAGDCLGQSYEHTMTVTESDHATGAVEATGFVTSAPTYDWTATGVVDGSGVTLTVSWTEGSGLQSYNPMVLTGTIDAQGEMSGTAVDGQARTFDWQTTAGEATAINRTPPTATLTAPASPTNAATLSYAVAFSESVTGLTAGDFTRTGTATGCSVGAPSGSGASYTVAVSGCSNGTVILTLKANSVSDVDANTGPAADVIAATVTIDRTAPGATLTAPSSPTNAATLSYTVTFSESVTGLIAGDFTRTGTATGCSVGAPSGSDASYTVAVTGCSDGTVVLALSAGSVLDAAGNTGPSAGVSAASVTVDRTGPTATLTAPDSPTNAATLTYALAFGESVTGLAAGDFGLTGTATGCSVGAPSGSGASYTIDVTGCSEGTAVLTLAATSVADGLGNSGPAAPVAADSVTIDRTGPSATITSPETPTNAVALTYDVAFDSDVTGLAATDFSTSGTATGCVVGAPTGSGDAYTVVLTGCSAGTVVLTLAADSVSDPHGNGGPAADVSATGVTIDRTAPTAASLVARPRTGTTLAGTAIPLTLTWTGGDNAGGVGVDRYQLERSVNGGAWTSVADSLPSASAQVTAASSGTVRYRVRAVDLAGNAGDWAATATFSPRLVEQTNPSVDYGGSWVKRTSAAYSGGSARSTGTAGRSVTYTFTGRSVAFVTTVAPTRGSIRVYVNGALIEKISLAGASTQYRTVAWQKTWTTAKSRTIRIVVVGTAGHPRVDADAFVVLK